VRACVRPKEREESKTHANIPSIKESAPEDIALAFTDLSLITAHRSLLSSV